MALEPSKSNHWPEEAQEAQSGSADSEAPTSTSTTTTTTTTEDNEIDQLAQLYQQAKDQNELLEFKNYELQFKIQELEQKQQKILNKFSLDNGQQLPPETGDPRICEIETSDFLKLDVTRCYQTQVSKSIRVQYRLVRSVLLDRKWDFP